MIVFVATGFGARNFQAPPGLYSALNPPPALAPFFHWDADAYGYIAHHGYYLGSGGVAAEPVRVAWFPFYPLLIALAGGSDWAMFIIPNVCLFATLAVLYAVALRRMDDGRSRLTLWLLALGPAAMFFSYPYTESAFLLWSVVAFAFMESGHWLWAGGAGLGAAMTRFPGVLVTAALGAEPVLGNRRRTVLLAIALPIVGLLAVGFIDRVQMGDPLGFVHARSFWTPRTSATMAPLSLVGAVTTAAPVPSASRPGACGVMTAEAHARVTIRADLRPHPSPRPEGARGGTFTPR